VPAKRSSVRRFAGATLRLAEDEECRNQQKPGKRSADHGGAPAVSLRDRSAEEVSQGSAYRYAHHEER